MIISKIDKTLDSKAIKVIFLHRSKIGGFILIRKLEVGLKVESWLDFANRFDDLLHFFKNIYLF